MKEIETVLKDSLIETLGQVGELFEYLPDVYFFAKDVDGNFIMANQLFIERCGELELEDILGKTDFDFFPLDRAKLYVADDNHVLRTGESIVNRVELAPDRHFTLNLFTTCKIALRDRQGNIVGIAGIARDLQRTSQTLKPFSHMSPAIDYIHENYADQIDITDLAKLAGMSMSQFERKFKKLFELTPQQYILEIRIGQACKLMLHSDCTLSQVAHECGFYDHSHFTRQFVKKFGVTPSEYNRKHHC